MGFFHFRVKKYIEIRLSDVDSPEKIQETVDEIIVSGLDAVIYDEKTAGEWYKYLVELAGTALSQKEQEYLHNV